MHDHDQCCEHGNLKYCKVCKVVYCTKCGKEWREGYWTYPPTYPTYPYPNTPWYVTTTDVNPNFTYSINTCTHGKI